jgi:hypothetical protein
MRSQGRLLLILPLLLALPIGCSNRNPHTSASVSGRITYKGNPVKAGNIVFYAKEAGAYTAVIRPDGTYTIAELPTGTLEVTIETESANPNKKQKTYGGGGKKNVSSPAPQGAPPSANPENYVAIPPRYSDRSNSRLSASLSGGSNTKDFELTD